MMIYKSPLVLCLLIELIYSVPIKLLLPLQQLQYGMPQQTPLIRQMLQANMNSPVVMYPQQPAVMILLPNIPTTAEDNDRYKNLNEQTQEDLKSNTGYIDEKTDAVVLDAEPNSVANGIRNSPYLSNTIVNRIRNEVLLRNQERLFIGNIISSIPFLPIEINVPDAVSWIYDLITSIGNYNPFRPQQPSDSAKRVSNRGPMMPVMVMPLGGGMLPMSV